MAKAGEAYAEAQELLAPPQDGPHQPPCYGVPVGAYPEEPPSPPSPRPYILIPLYHGLRRRRGLSRRFSACCYELLSASLHALVVTGFVLGVASFLLWPSDPDVRLVKLKLRSVRVSTKHKGTLVALDVAMDLKVRVRNRAFFALDYDNVTVGIEYRGRPLGAVVAGGGRMAARRVSYLKAKLRLDGIRVLEDALFLIEDLVKGKIPFDTITQLDGNLSFLSLEVPIQGRISCAVNVDVENQAIASQDCYPDVS